MGPLVVAVALVLVSGSLAQRVAPGVPPQHYQQQNGQGQFQQPQHQQQQQFQQQQQQPQFQQQQQHVAPGVHPGQYQQPGVHPDQFQAQQQQQQQQFQQPPPQHQQQQQMPPQHQQQVPQPQQGHHAPHHQPAGFNPGHIDDHERQHIADHAEVPLDTSKMSEQELQFHYFKMHDADSNNKLDGCELIKSLIHYHEQGSKEGGHEHGEPQAPKVEEKIFSDEELVALIDPILQMDDMNRDGFIDYPEFIRAQQKAQTKD